MIEETVDDIALQTGELDATMRHQLINRLTDRENSLALDHDDGAPPAYGHVIVDEAQDLSPMQWRMVARRNPAGSMTIVGDLGQSSRLGAIHTWDEALAQLPARREPRMAELTINYRTPSEIMDLAAAVLQVTDPGLEPPKSVRTSGARPRFTPVAPDQLVAEVTDQVVRLRSELGDGKVAVIAPPDRVAVLAERLGGLGDLDFRTGADALDAAVALFTPTQAKGLEFDAVVLVEPDELAGSTVDGLRGLYVALTRATRFLAVVHSGGLPEPLRHR
jgi:DNA helicase IV